MTFRLNNRNYNLLTLMRDVGYVPVGNTPEGELNCVRRLGGDYPRFHIYLKEDKDVLVFNLHLDQKKPSYEGTSAHGGEYDGDTVREEMERVKEVIFRKY